MSTYIKSLFAMAVVISTVHLALPGYAQSRTVRARKTSMARAQQPHQYRSNVRNTQTRRVGANGGTVNGGGGMQGSANMQGPAKNR